MKKTILWLAALGLASCSQMIEVEVTNNTKTEREDETIEIAWSEIVGIEGLTPENIVVLDHDGDQVPSQVIYLGNTEPQSLIFQTDVDEKESKLYKIKKGSRENYRAKAFGRYVPERHEDYAWENNLGAYRLYGPALETAEGQLLVTPGIDVWVKCKEKLVIDAWYAKGDYHHNYGDGMDCYKVGKTLGGGASAPLVNGQLWLSRNYASQQTLDNGPIRTTVKLTYAPFDVNGTQVSLTKYISLDANSYFNRMENIYDGDFIQMPVASGFVRHDVKEVFTGKGWLGMVEASSDTKQPEVDGDIFFGIIQSGADVYADTLGHAVAIKTVAPGQKEVFYTGSAWSLSDVDSPAEWLEEIEAQNAKITSPLQVVIR